MQRRRTAGYTLATASICGLLAFVLAPSEKTPVEITVVGSQPAEIVDDAGAEMSLLTLVISRPAHTKSAVYFGRNPAVVEFKIGDRWNEVKDTFCLGSLGADETKKEVLLRASGADRCRIRLKYAGASVWWILGWFVSRRGIKLPPSYWDWAGWPNAEGAHPHWKDTTIEIPLAPNLLPLGDSNRVHNERSGVDAGRASLLAFLCAWPGATHRGRWAASQTCD
jgi:hypothetical protein